MPDTYTTREVARQLGMAVRSVQMMVDRGELEAWKTPGGHRRISRLSVESWRAARGLQPLPGPAAGPPPVALARAQPPGNGAAARAPSASAAPVAPLIVPLNTPGVASFAAPSLPSHQAPLSAQALPHPSAPHPNPHPMRRATDRIGPPPRLVQHAFPSPQAALTGLHAAGATPGGPVAPATPGPSVLLIEDSVHYQNLMALLLRQHFPGLPFYLASDGISGLAMAGQLQPQVLVVDILLPGIDGSALITGLRSHAQFEGTQLIVITSLDENQREPYAHALSGIAVVHKPRLAVDLPPLLRQMLAAGPPGTNQPTPPSQAGSTRTVAR